MGKSRARSRDARDRKAATAIGEEFIAPPTCPKTSFNTSKSRRRREARDRAAAAAIGEEYIAPSQLRATTVSTNALRRARVRREQQALAKHAQATKRAHTDKPVRRGGCVIFGR